jgi:tetratricopeptide (TPR) repeat protein/predicted Ser/Thr protein kinase
MGDCPDVCDTEMSSDPVCASVARGGSEAQGGNDGTSRGATAPFDGVSAIGEHRIGRSFGRYRIDRVLGVGAMGTVVVAWDRTLGREVALKLLHRAAALGPEARSRFQREARMLAQLTHPNVVQVFEVGRLDETPFLAMELIRGPSLRAWLGMRRTTAEVLDVFHQAALGLFAAHQRGVVHRDFKLDNVVVGEDGRVRVVDFGLAMEETEGSASTESGRASVTPTSSRLTATGAILGTPAYMAPEQHLGGRATPRSDQFAFCVALFEGLYGNRPFPGQRAEAVLRLISDRRIAAPQRPRRVGSALRCALRRGLEPFPDDRWPDMRPIIAALRGSGGRRRLWPLGAVPVAAAVLTWLPARGSDRDVCAEAIGGTPWTQTRRAEMRARFEAAELPFAAQSWSRVEASLDAHAREFDEAVAIVCERDHSDGEADSRARAVACLRGDGSRTAAVIDALLGEGSGPVLAATRSVRELSSPADCVGSNADASRPVPDDPALASSVSAIRTRLDRARALGDALSFDAAVAEAEAAAEAAEALGWVPMLAEAHFGRGRVRAAMGRMAEAAEAYSDAYYAALEGRHDRVAANAAIQLVYIRTTADFDLEDAQRWLAASDAAVRRLASDDEMRAWHLNAVARVARASGRYDDALAARRDAAARIESIHGAVSAPLAPVLNELGNDLSSVGNTDAARETLLRAMSVVAHVHGPDHPEIAPPAANLCRIAFDAADFEEAETQCRRAVEVSSAAYGPDDDRTMRSTFMLQSVLHSRGKLEESETLLRAAVEQLERQYGPDHPEAAYAVAALASLLKDKGAQEEAEALFWRAIERLRRRAPQSSQLAVSLVNCASLLFELGRRDEAGQLVIEAREIIEATYGPDHPMMRIALMNHGGFAIADGRVAEARRLFGRALEIGVVELGEDHPDLAGAHCALGGVARAEGDFPQAYTHFERAVALGERAGEADAPDLACALTGWGQTLVDEHLYAEAQPLLERVVRLGEARRIYPWYAIEAREALVKVLWRTPSERPRAVALAVEARALCGPGPDFLEPASRLDDWLARHRVGTTRS